MKITDLALLELTGDFRPAPIHAVERQALPMDAYGDVHIPGYPGPAPDPTHTVRCVHVYLEVQTDAGLTGLFGPVDGAHASVLRHELRSVVVGAHPLATFFPLHPHLPGSHNC